VDAYWNFAFNNKEYYQLMFGLGMQCCGKGQMKKEFSSFQDLIYECTYNIIRKTDRIRIVHVICLMLVFSSSWNDFHYDDAYCRYSFYDEQNDFGRNCFGFY
jgi:hypothetical protein